MFVVESFVWILINQGVDICFINLGILEMYMVVVFDWVDGMKFVLCLFEGVVIGVVDGYVCMFGKLAVMLLYFGLGVVNGLVNFYNVWCVYVLVVNIVGDYVQDYL